MCVCVCVCAWLGSSLSFKQVSLNNKDTFCQHSCNRALSCSQRSFGFRLYMDLHKLFQVLLDPSLDIICACLQISFFLKYY